MNLKRLTVLGVTAGLAVLFACGPREGRAPSRDVVIQRGACVGEVVSSAPDERADALGPYFITTCRLTLRRWEDGAGVVADDVTLVAARRPGGAVYYMRGAWAGGSFVYRAGRAWRLTVRDEFGNATTRTGPGAPALFAFRGVALPPYAAAGPPGDYATTLELTDGSKRAILGRRAGRSWYGRGRGAYVRLAYGRDGGLAAVDGLGGVTVSRADGRERRDGFVYETPRLAYLPFIFRPGIRDWKLELPLAARLNVAADAAPLAASGQEFTGATVGNTVTGTFTLAPSSQPALNAAADAVFTPAAWGLWPTVQGDGALARLAARARRDGKRVRYVTGVGLFAGNVLAPYEWLEINGVPTAAPGRPVPQAYVVFARGVGPVTVEDVALAGEPKAVGRGVSYVGDGIPGLKPRGDLSYDVSLNAVAAGDVNISYETFADLPPAAFYEGRYFGRGAAGVAWGSCWDGAAWVPFGAARDGLAAFVALGAAVATTKEEYEPPYEFCLPTADGGVARVRWQGMAPVVAGGEWRLCRVYEVEPGPFRAYYTYDGVLARVEAPGYAARLRVYPSRKGIITAAAEAAPPAAAPVAPAPTSP